MTIKQLNDKYSFSRTMASERSGVSYYSVINFLRGRACTVKTARAIINALPITPEERSSLIESMFAPDAKD